MFAATRGSTLYVSATVNTGSFFAKLPTSNCCNLEDASGADSAGFNAALPSPINAAPGVVFSYAPPFKNVRTGVGDPPGASVSAIVLENSVGFSTTLATSLARIDPLLIAPRTTSGARRLSINKTSPLGTTPPVALETFFATSSACSAIQCSVAPSGSFS